MSSAAEPTAHPLETIFAARSVAVVGASANPAKRGYQILRGLGESGYRGRVFPVNPRGGSILGHQVFPSLRSLPEAADLAVFCTPAEAAPDLIADCGTRGVGAAVVLAVGFAETGAEGAELERRLVDAGRKHGVRIVGPNTSGLLSLHDGLNLIGARGMRPGGIALLVQSGNMALALMNEITERTWEGISVCVGLGNEADVGFAESLDYLAQHHDTRAIVVYAEGLRDARAYLAAATRVGREKPVVMIKAGRTERGATSALSHTGAVAGHYDRLRAGLAQSGAVEVLRTDELIHIAETLANQPPCVPGTGIAILSDGGGQSTLVVDTLGELGAPLAALGESTRDGLRDVLGRAAAVANPVDLAGAADADPTAFASALELIARDPAVGAVLIVGLFGGYGVRFADQLTEPETRAAYAMADAMSRMGKGLVVHSMYASHRTAPLEALGHRHVPVIGSLDVACRCVAELERRGRQLTRPMWEGPRPRRSHDEVPDVISAVRSASRTLLTEPEARSLLGEHGVSFDQWTVVHSAGEAASAVAALGRGAAIKVVSEVVTHKSDVGGVVLGIGGEPEARHAFETVVARAADHVARLGLGAEAPAALVTPMADAPLAELLIGAYRDPQLGPVLTIGTGGVWVEVLEDVTHRVLPVTPDDVREMLGELRTKPLFDGFRGATAADLEPVVLTAMAVADCIERCPDVLEIEVNPLFVYPDAVSPLDARVVLMHDAG